MTVIYLIIASAFAICGAAIWLVFLRPVPRSWAQGTITAKTFAAGEPYVQTPVGLDRGFRAPTVTPMAGRYVLQIQLDEPRLLIRNALNEMAARSFEVGQRVRVQYERRGIPLLWTRVYVREMIRAADQGSEERAP